MKKYLFFIIVLNFTLILEAQDKPSFSQLLSENYINFKKPTNYKVTEVIENPKLNYQYAIAQIKDSIEVRYTIFPLSKLVDDYEQSILDGDETAVDPNKYYESMYMANILNIAKTEVGDMPNPKPLHEKVTAIEFGADYAATSLFECSSSFAKEYKYCFFILVHKSNTADIYISFLCNDETKIEQNILDIFKSINFVNE